MEWDESADYLCQHHAKEDQGEGQMSEDCSASDNVSSHLDFDYLYQHYTDTLSSLINASSIVSSNADPDYDPDNETSDLDYDPFCDPDGETADLNYDPGGEATDLDYDPYGEHDDDNPDGVAGDTGLLDY